MSSTPSLSKAILATGFLAGTLDALTASVQFLISSGGKNPALVFRYVASGVFGKDAFTSDLLTMASFGLFFHYCIALTYTAFYFLVLAKLFPLIKHKIISGICYGLAVWAMMKFVVLPLSKGPPNPSTFTKSIVAATILVLMIGLPISIGASRYYSKLK